MAASVFLVSPVAPPGSEAAIGHGKISGNGPLRLALLDNGKFNAAELLDFIAEQLQADLRIGSILRERKQSMSSPASEEVLEKLSSQSDLALSAMAD